jgi:phage terminase large subunit
LYYDNPYTAESYKSSLLSITDKSTKERLMFGNWDYETGDDSLMPYQKLVELYTNTFVKPGDKKYIVVDVARFGKDRTVVSLWHGLVLKKWYVFGRQSTTETAKVVIALSDTHSVPRSQIIIDDGGISGGVVDQVSGCSPFLGARSSFNTESNNFVNYGNLRAQSYFKLADMVNTNQIYIEDTEYKEVVLEELEQIKKKDIEKEGKIYIVEKEKMKEVLGRSPDFADVLQMRMLPELVNQEAFVLTDESGLIF